MKFFGGNTKGGFKTSPYFFMLLSLLIYVGAGLKSALFAQQRVVVLQGIVFDLNSSGIRPDMLENVKNVGKAMQDYPIIKILIEGHNDVTEDNKLSVQRAQVIKDYLVKNFKISADRILIKSYGNSRPISSLNTPEGRAINRRVEFSIARQKR